MIHIGEPMLKPFLLAMALMYVALISQPIWAKQPASTGATAQPAHSVYYDVNDT